MRALFLLAALLGLTGDQRPLDVRQTRLEPKGTPVTVDISSIEGRPARLAWSPDARALYLRFTKRDVWGNERDTHYLLSLVDGRCQSAAGEPDWAAGYWIWKSALEAPGLPEFRITVETRQERKTATGVVSAGTMAQSGGDPSLGAVLGPQGQAIAQSAMQAQMVTTTTLKVKGVLLAEFVNEAAALGRVYAWAPRGFGALAFIGAHGRVTLMDAAGHRQPVGLAGDWTLPAWSPDGSQLACVKVEGKKKLTVHVFSVSTH
jgi:hypothetical protein